MRVLDGQLTHILDDDEPLALCNLAEQSPQQGGLAGAGAAADHERAAPGHQSLEHPQPACAERPPAGQLHQAGGHPPRDTQADVGALHRDRRKHGVQPDATGKQPIDIRAGVVEAATGDPGQTYGESADCELVADLAVGPGQAVAAIDPHAGARVDQDIGDLRVGEKPLQRAGAQDLCSELGARAEGTRLTEHHGLSLKNLRNQPRGRRPARPDLGPHRG